MVMSKNEERELYKNQKNGLSDISHFFLWYS